MGTPRGDFRRGLTSLYNYLDNEIPLGWPRSNVVLWVHSGTGVDDVNHGAFDTPFKTVAYAVSAANAARGDRIVVKAGHAETIADATTFALNKAGVEIVGLGEGYARPTFTIGTANTATIPVSADNISVKNCIFVANFLSIAACFTLAAAKNFKVQDCLFQDASGVLDFLNIIKSTGIANTVDGLTAINNKWISLGTTSVNTFVLTANDIDRLTLLWNVIMQVTTVDAASLLVVTAGVLTNLDCGYNKTYRKNTTSTASLISVGGTTSVGLVYNNYTQTKDTSTNVLFATTVGLAAFENRITGATGATGFVIPAVDS